MGLKWIFCPLLLVLAAIMDGQSTVAGRKLTGSLGLTLNAGDRFQTELLVSATAADRAALPLPIAPTDLVFVGTTFFRKGKPLKLALVEPAKGDPVLLADLNQNGLFEPNERFAFATPDRVVLLKVPLNDSAFPFYPIRIKLPPQTAANSENRRTLLRSPFAFVEGWADIAGRKTLAKFEFNVDKNDAYPDYGWIGMDVNSDGRIDEQSNNEEYTFANDESVIFHVDGLDVSTVSLNLKTGRFLLLEHPAGDNLRIQLQAGEAIPDFEFTDLDGKTRRFSEFRGHYVLLDFWGTWCGPCRRELPTIEKISRQFRARNLLALGMNDDRDVAKVRLLLQGNGITFPQSTGDMGHELVYKRFRIDAFPTEVLTDPSGKIVDTPNDALRGERLGPTLDKLQP